MMRQVPEDGLHIASSFVHALLLTISTYHLAYCLRNPDRNPQVQYDFHKHILLSIRASLAFLLTFIPAGELVYQLAYLPDEPRNYPILFYTEAALTIVAWFVTFLSSWFLAKNCSWKKFRPLDYLCQMISWLFVFAIQTLRFAEFVFGGVVFSMTERLTATMVFSATIIYGGTLLGFLLVEPLRNRGMCVKQYDALEDLRDASEDVDQLRRDGNGQRVMESDGISGITAVA